MAQDEDEELSILTRLGLNPRAVALARARTPIPRRRAVLNRDLVKGSSRGLRVASRIATAPIVLSVHGAGREELEARDPSRLEGEGGGTSSGCDEEGEQEDGNVCRDDAPKGIGPAMINQQFRVSTFVTSTDPTGKTPAKKPVKITYGRRRLTRTPVPVSTNRDIYQLESDGSDPTTSVPLSHARLQDEELFSLERASNESQENVAEVGVLHRATSIESVGAVETSQESPSLLENLALQRKTPKRSAADMTGPIVGGLFFATTSSQEISVSGHQELANNQEIPGSEATTFRTKAETQLMPIRKHQLGIEEKFNHGQEVVGTQREGNADDNTALQEVLDDLDLEILQLLEKDEHASTRCCEIEKRRRTTPEPITIYRQRVDLDEEEQETEELITPAPKKRRLGTEVIDKKTAPERTGKRRASKVTEKAVIDRKGAPKTKSEISQERLNKTRGKRIRRLPVSELIISSEKMTAPSEDDNPAELSEDPISQVEDNRRARKRFDLKLNFPQRNGFGHIEIALFRVPKSQGNRAGPTGLSYNDGFEGDEAKPTKIYMPSKRLSRRRDALDKYVIRMPRLTIVAERPSAEEEVEDQPLRAKKTKRGPRAEQVGPIIRNEQNGIMTDNQRMQTNYLQDLVEETAQVQDHDAGPSPPSKSQEAVNCGAKTFRSRPIRASRSGLASSKMSQRPVSNYSLPDQKREVSQNGGFIEMNNSNNGYKENSDVALPLKLRIFQDQDMSHGLKHPISSRRRLINARQNSIKVSQELSLVSIKRKSPDTDESECETGSRDSKESTSNYSSSDNDGDGTSYEDESGTEDEDGEISEEICLEDDAAFETIESQYDEPDQLAVASPERLNGFSDEKTSIQTFLQPNSKAQRSAELGVTQKNHIAANEEEDFAMGHEQLRIEKAQINSTPPIEDQDSSFDHREEAFDSQQTPDEEITPTQLLDLADEAKELVLANVTQIMPTVKESLGDEEVTMSDPILSSQIVVADRLFKLGSIDVAGVSLFGPEKGPSSRRQHVSSAVMTKEFTTSHAQRESQQSFLDTQTVWRPRAPNVVDMSFESGDDIIDKFSSPTRLPSQFRAPSRHHKQLRWQSMGLLKSSKNLPPRSVRRGMEVSTKIALLRGELSPRHSQAEFIPSQLASSLKESQPSTFSQSSQILPKFGTYESPETSESQMSVHPQALHSLSATRHLSAGASDQPCFSLPPSRPYPAYLSTPQLSKSSRPVLMPGVALSIISSPPKTIIRPRQRSLLWSTPSQRSLSALTRQASQKLGTLPGAPLSSGSAKKRIPSLLQRQPSRKQ